MRVRRSWARLLIAGALAVVGMMSFTAESSRALAAGQQVVTFSTTPSNSVPSGTAVTVSVSAKDQTGSPVAGDQVKFLRSGPNESSCTPSYPQGYSATTDVSGNAGFSFTCTNAGTSTVTITVQDSSGNQIATGTQQVAFSGTSNGGSTAGADYVAQTPSRVLGPQSIAANSTFPFMLPSSVPAGAGAVALNVTAVHPATVGNLRVSANCGSAVTSTSLINYQPGQDTANFVVVPLQCAAGSAPVNSINVYSSNSAVSVDVDLAGYFPTTTSGTGASTVYTTPGFTGVGPTRAVSEQSIPANTAKTFALAGIPSGAKAVALNVTSIHPNGNGNLRVYPGDQTATPTTSNVNFIPGVDKAGFVIINLPADGSKAIKIYSAGRASSVDVDVFGVVPALGATTGLAQPVRVLDTRTGSGTTQGLPSPLQTDMPYNVKVTGNGVPSNAVAVLVSLTAIHAPSSAGVGNLRAFPAGESEPNVSNINYIGPTADVANLAIIKIGSNGQITLETNGSVIDAAVDVLGYVPAAS